MANAYTNRKNATNELIKIRVLQAKARQELDNATEGFYRSMASIIRSQAYGEENAKPAMYFARLMSNDLKEQHAIATTIGVCGNVADDDFWAIHNGCDEEISNGYVSGFLSPLRRKVENKVVRWAEVDENGNVVGKIHEREKQVYIYYWAK